MERPVNRKGPLFRPLPRHSGRVFAYANIPPGSANCCKWLVVCLQTVVPLVSVAISESRRDLVLSPQRRSHVLCSRFPPEVTSPRIPTKCCFLLMALDNGRLYPCFLVLIGINSFSSRDKNKTVTFYPFSFYAITLLDLTLL